MKARLLPLLITILLVNSSSGQNLVPNPSFEDTVYCPNSLDNLNAATGWSSFGLSPDYFNTCANETPFTPVGAPSNAWGFQNPYEGNGYACFISYTTFFSDGREYLGTKLSSALIEGIKYFISAYVSRADINSESCATNNLGFKLSTKPYSVLDPVPINNLAQVNCDSIIKDQINWTQISGFFIADSSYEYLIIGNFYDDDHTDTFNCAVEGVYYLDHVCLSTDSLMCNEEPDGISPFINFEVYDVYPNPANSTLQIAGISKSVKYELFNCIGQQISTGTLNPKSNFIDVSGISNGTYFLHLAENYNFKFVIIHSF